jgi:hypothetical protein
LSAGGVYEQAFISLLIGLLTILFGMPRNKQTWFSVAPRAIKSTFPFDVGTTEEDQMQKLAFIAGAFAILSAPALAGTVTGDKPMVVAEEGVSVSVGGDHDRDRDRDRRHHVVILHHHDEDHDRDHHHKVAIIHGHHDEDDHH